MLRRMFQFSIGVSLAIFVTIEVEAYVNPRRTAESSTAVSRNIAPGEFEPQEYIWLSWREEGFLGTAPFSDVATDVMKAITPYVKVRLMFSDEQPPYASKRLLPLADAEQLVRAKLKAKGVDLSRVELFFIHSRTAPFKTLGPSF